MTHAAHPHAAANMSPPPTGAQHAASPWSAAPLAPPSPLLDNVEGTGDVSDLLAACNAYVDNIVSENQRMRSKLLSCRSSIKGPRE